MTLFVLRRTALAMITLLLAPALFVSLSFVRAWRVAEGAGNYVGCHDCFWLATFGHDAWLLAIVLGLLAMANATRRRWAAASAGALAGLILLVFASDIALDSLLSQRLHFGDVLRFGGDLRADLSVLRATLLSSIGAGRLAIVLLALAIAIGLGVTTRHQPKAAIAFAFAAGVLGVFSSWALSRPVRYINQIFTYNVFEANLPQGRTRAFSGPFLAEARRRAAAMPLTCSRSAPFSGSVVIVLVESLSAWHSKLLGSPLDWTPRLDAMARRNHYFTRFYANGFSTSMAEIAVLSGHLPITPAGKRLLDFDDFADPDGTLVDIAHRSGREAAFFTSGDVTFLGLGEWLGKLGFDVIDGSTDAYYKGMKRWQFGAADDAALYDRFLQWLGDRDNSRPFVATLLTVSTHPPFVDPRTAKIDPQRSFGYADEQLARFHRALKERGFLDKGVLLVLGDHRTMTPLHDFEYRNHGERAFARVPLVVAGAVDMPAVIDAPFQQTDIVPSIADLLGVQSCASPFVGRFARYTPEPPAYVAHVRGDDRNRVDMYWDGDGLAGFQLDGDASAWESTVPPRAQDMAAWINSQRATHVASGNTAAQSP